MRSANNKFLNRIVTLVIILAVFFNIGLIFQGGGVPYNGIDPTSNNALSSMIGSGTENIVKEDNATKQETKVLSTGTEIRAGTNWETQTCDDGNTYYLIDSAEKLYHVRDFIEIDIHASSVNSLTRHTAEVKPVNFKLTADIHLNSFNNGRWVPIYKVLEYSDGNASSISEVFGFSGIFDGNGHTISGLNIYNDTSKESPRSDTYYKNSTKYYNIPCEYLRPFNADSLTPHWEVYAGLFAKIHGGVIKNLHLDSPIINLKYHAAKDLSTITQRAEDYDIFAGCLAGSVETEFHNEQAVKNAGLDINKSTTIESVMVTNPNINVNYSHKVDNYSISYIALGGLMGRNYIDTTLMSCVVKGGSIFGSGETSYVGEEYTSATNSDYNFKIRNHSAGIRFYVGGQVGGHGITGLNRYWWSDDALPCTLICKSCYVVSTIMQGNQYHKQSWIHNETNQERTGVYVGGILGAVHNIYKQTDDNGAVISKCFVLMNEASQSNNIDIKKQTDQHSTKYEFFQPISAGVVNDAGICTISNCYYYDYSTLSPSNRYRFGESVGLQGQGNTTTRNLDWFSNGGALNWLNAN